MKLTNQNQTALLIEVNCETDFVAKTDMFQNGVISYLETLNQTEDADFLIDEKDSEESKKKFLNMKLVKSLDPELSEMNAKEGLTYLISKTRENCNIGR